MDTKELLERAWRNHEEGNNDAAWSDIAFALIQLRDELATQQPLAPDAAKSWRCRCGWANFENVKLCSACGTQRK